MDFEKRQTELIRLLKMTSDNKSQVVLGLRKLIQSYVNDCEEYISQLEMDNYQLTITNDRNEKLYKYEKQAREILQSIYLSEIDKNSVLNELKEKYNVK
jgi:hypothetical protein